MELDFFFYVLDIIHSPAAVSGKIPVHANGAEIFQLESSYLVEERIVYSLWRNNPCGQLIMSNFVLTMIDSEQSFTVRVTQAEQRYQNVYELVRHQ